MTIIENDFLKVAIRNKGGELTSILNKVSGVEQLWQGDTTIRSDKLVVGPALMIVAKPCGDQGSAERFRNACVGVDQDRRRFRLGHAEVLAQRADGGDEFLRRLHRADGGRASGEVGGLRVAGEGHRFCGRLAGVECVPDLLGEEGHEG